MKKNRLLFCALCLSAVFFLSGAVRTIYDDSVTLADTSETGYIMRETDGFIGLYEGDSEIPYQMLDVLVDELPESDRELLRRGIEVKSKEELNALIEDYTG